MSDKTKGPTRFGMVFIAVLLSVAQTGCNRLSFSDSVESMTLYSLDGGDPVLPDEKAKGELFHQFSVLGKTKITSAADRRAILAVVQKGMDHDFGSEPHCFWPRHGLRLVQHGRHIDFVICFQCEQLDEYTDSSQSHKRTGNEASGLLNAQLQQAHVPLAK